MPGKTVERKVSCKKIIGYLLTRTNRLCTKINYIWEICRLQYSTRIETYTYPSFLSASNYNTEIIRDATASLSTTITKVAQAHRSRSITGSNVIGCDARYRWFAKRGEHTGSNNFTLFGTTGSSSLHYFALTGFGIVYTIQKYWIRRTIVSHSLGSLFVHTPVECPAASILKKLKLHQLLFS